MGQLHHLEQVVDHPGHQLPRAVFIVEPEGQLLQVAEQVAAHVRFHVRPQHVPPVIHKILKSRPDKIGGHQGADHGEKHSVGVFRQQLLHRPAGNHGEEKIHRGDHQGAEHIQSEQLPIGPVIPGKLLDHGSIDAFLLGDRYSIRHSA